MNTRYTRFIGVLLAASLLMGRGSSHAAAPSIRINEILTANANGIFDEDGDQPDWVEILNSGEAAIDLEGWTLTDDPDDPIKWILPNIIIGPGEYRIVFCSGKDRRPITSGANLHTNFKLDVNGEYLAIRDDLGQVIDEFNPYPQQRRDVSFGWTEPGGSLRYFTEPTPASTNSFSTITGIVADTKFSPNRGFFSTNVSLSLSSATSNAVIRYTLDGTEPTLTNGFTYGMPLLITNNAAVRAKAFKNGLLATDVDCHSYLFPEMTIRQSPNGQAPDGWPNDWGFNEVDYGMDPEIIDHPDYRHSIADDLKSIPSMSLVMDLEDLFDPQIGIYANAFARGTNWERACSLELIQPSGARGFQINTGVRIRGGISRQASNPKHGFRFLFRERYGPKRLNFPLFGRRGVSSFDKIDLRNESALAWSRVDDLFTRRCAFMRDQFSRDIQLAMGHPAKRGDFFHLYINGQYWGLYNTEERADAAYAESYIGGRESDYDILKVGSGANAGSVEAPDGNLEAWRRVWDRANAGFLSNEAYFAIQGRNPDGAFNPSLENLIDIPNLIDYMLLILFTGNLDAPISHYVNNNAGINNWYAARNRDNLHGGFRFLVHDSEVTLGLNPDGFPDDHIDRTGPWPAGDPLQGSDFSKSNPQYIWQQLQANAEFRLKVADHVQRHFFDDGVFTSRSTRQRLLVRSNQIYGAVVAESARWGDAKQETPRTRNGDWLGAVKLIHDHLGVRPAIVLDQLREDNLFPDVLAPGMNMKSGLVAPGSQLILTNHNASGTIFYTMDGTDPRRIGGPLSLEGRAYSQPITLNANAHVKARILAGSTWSPLTEAILSTEQNMSDLQVTEIMYHPPGDAVVQSTDLEFLELKNSGTNSLNLGGFRFTDGINFAFTNGTTLAPGEFFLLARNPTLFATRYPGVTVHGVFTGKLNNGGERLTLSYPVGTRAISVAYKDSGRWPITPDGFGFSLVPRNSTLNPDPDRPWNWRASRHPGGSPGSDDPLPSTPTAVINEVLTHPYAPLSQSVELYNPTTETIDMGGWFLTNDRTEPHQHVIPNGTVISPNSYLVLSEGTLNPSPAIPGLISLDPQGGEIYLFSGNQSGDLTGYSHGFGYGASQGGESFGRHLTSNGEEHFPGLETVSLDQPNSPPRVGPIVITKIMYHPPDLPWGEDNTDMEFIEMRNISDQAVPLYDPLFPSNTWKLRDAVEFRFPSGMLLEPGERIVLVGFDPANEAQRLAFEVEYPTLAGIPLFGPYLGKLDNSDESVELVRPGQPGILGVPEILVERVHYFESAPWPPAADGSGAALHRLDSRAYGNDPAHWTARPMLKLHSAPTNINAWPGSNVQFQVEASGAGWLNYQWYFDGSPISGATNNSFQINNVQASHDGLYIVNVIDSHSSVMSKPARLAVLFTPEVIMPPLDQAVVEGGNLTLSIRTSGTLPMTYRWRRGSFTVADVTLDSHQDFLTIHDVDSADAGVYSVVLHNAASPPRGILSPRVRVSILADTDTDGLPDEWETATGISSPSQDADSDGISNLEEYQAGTDPTNPEDYLKIDRITSEGSVQIEFLAASNRTYTVEFTDLLVSNLWQKLEDIPASVEDQTVAISDTPHSTNRFYRLVTPRQP